MRLAQVMLHAVWGLIPDPEAAPQARYQIQPAGCISDTPGLQEWTHCKSHIFQDVTLSWTETLTIQVWLYVTCPLHFFPK